MALVPKIDPNKIFASNAPTQDKPAAFANYEKGMDETRKNLGRPTIPQLNYLHQTADQKILWIHQNGGGLPYDASIEYAENAVTLKDGELKQLVDGAWVEAKTKANAITTASSQNQQEINDFGGAKWYAKAGGYELGATVKLDNGDTVQSTKSANIANPNFDMTEWFNTSRYFNKYNTADPRDFGAPNNGVDDDAPAMRKAISFLDSIGGGRIKADSRFKFIVKSLSESGQDAFIIKSPILIDLGEYGAGIEATIPMRSVFKIGMDGTNYQPFWGFRGGVINGKKLATHIVYSESTAYTPYVNLINTTFKNAVGEAVSINPYMGYAKGCFFSFSAGGLLFNNTGGVREITSMTVDNCYSNGNAKFGFKANNRMLYSSFISCGVDECGGEAYDLDMQGGTILNCGAERSLKLLRMPNINDGVSIIGLTGIGIGSLDPDSPVDGAIEFSGSGSRPNNLLGVSLSNHPTQARYRDVDLVVNTSQDKYPRVTTDSITRGRSKANFIGGVVPVFDEPITFTVSAFRKNGTEAIATTALKARLDELNKSELQFRYVIQLTAAAENQEKVIEGIHGTGIFTIQGVGTDNTKAKIRGARLGLIIRNCSATIVIRYLTIENNTGYDDNALAQVTVDNCREVIFEAVKFDATKNTIGTAIRATNNSHVKLRGGTVADTRHGATTAYQAQTGSTIEIEPMTAPPTDGRWIIGQRVKNSDMGISNIVEWVYVRNAGNTANEWRPITV